MSSVEQQAVVMHAWRLDTSAIACMAVSCHRVAEAVANVWVNKREWLVVFLCKACLFRARYDVDVLKVLLNEKRINQREMVELGSESKRKKRGEVA